jgi:hypothetical protein
LAAFELHDALSPVLLLDRWDDHERPPAGPGTPPLTSKQVALGVNPHDLEVLLAPIDVAVLTRHALALEHATRGLALTDGTRRTVRQRVAVGVVLAPEVVPTDATGEAATLGDAANIHLLSGLEQRDTDL